MFAQITLRNSFQPDHVSDEKHFLAGIRSTFLAIARKSFSVDLNERLQKPKWDLWKVCSLIMQ